MFPGSFVDKVLAYDADQEGTLNSQLSYTIMSQDPSTPKAFSIDSASGQIQTLRKLQRKEHKLYNLDVKVNDKGNTHAVCLKHTSE